MTELLKLQQIGHQYKDDAVIKNITFSLVEGEIATIVGPSGSGKSTILNIVGGMFKPTDGEVLMNGETITNSTGHVSLMPQSHSLMPWRTVFNNINLANELSGINNDKRTMELLHRAGFTHIKDVYPNALSGGMKQRVSFLRALNSDHKLLLLDEPFSALDEITREDMQFWLKGMLKETNKSVLMITHSIEEAIKISDTIYILNGQPATIVKEIKVSDITNIQRTKDVIKSLLK